MHMNHNSVTELFSQEIQISVICSYFAAAYLDRLALIYVMSSSILCIIMSVIHMTTYSTN